MKLNPGQVCFYRTNYSSDMLKSIIPAIPSLSAVDRLGVENDMFSLAVAGFSETENFLELLSGYQNEDNYTVWADIDGNLSRLSVLMQNTDNFDSFKDYVLKLYKPVADRLGWEPKEDEGWKDFIFIFKLFFVWIFSYKQTNAAEVRNWKACHDKSKTPAIQHFFP